MDTETHTKPKATDDRVCPKTPNQHRIDRKVYETEKDEHRHTRPESTDDRVDSSVHSKVYGTESQTETHTKPEATDDRVGPGPTQQSIRNRKIDRDTEATDDRVTQQT